MTKSTDSRQLGIIFRGILEKHQAWEALVKDGRDLQVEMDLVSAAKMFFAEVKQTGAVSVREKIFETLQLSVAKSAKTDDMMARLKSAFGINAGGSEWEDVLAFLIREDERGRTIELFSKACQDDKFEMPKAHQIAQKPKLIMTMWPRAFKDNQPVNPAKPDTDGGYRI